VFLDEKNICPQDDAAWPQGEGAEPVFQNSEDDLEAIWKLAQKRK